MFYREFVMEIGTTKEKNGLLGLMFKIGTDWTQLWNFQS
jgi:hypothetical protein